MVAKRLSDYIGAKQISYYAFENSIGASRGAISKAVKDNKSIGSHILENILRVYPDINPAWLLTGVGSMCISPSSPTGKDNFEGPVINKLAINNGADHLKEANDLLKQNNALLLYKIEQLEKKIAEK